MIQALGGFDVAGEQAQGGQGVQRVRRLEVHRAEHGVPAIEQVRGDGQRLVRAPTLGKNIHQDRLGAHRRAVVGSQRRTEAGDRLAGQPLGFLERTKAPVQPRKIHECL